MVKSGNGRERWRKRGRNFSCRVLEMDIAAKFSFSTRPIPLNLLSERSSCPLCDYTVTYILVCHYVDSTSCCKTPCHTEEAFNLIERRYFQSYFNIGDHQVWIFSRHDFQLAVSTWSKSRKLELPCKHAIRIHPRGRFLYRGQQSNHKFIIQHLKCVNKSMNDLN